MSKIAIHIGHPLVNGEYITFRAPCSSGTATGLRIYTPTSYEDETEISTVYTMQDADKTTVHSMDGLFVTGAYVTVSLDTENTIAYLQNAKSVYPNGDGAALKINSESVPSDNWPMPSLGETIASFHGKVRKFFQTVYNNVITGLSVSGKKITYTKADGTTGSIDTQDTWKQNTSDQEGYVTKGSGQVNKVWKTDSSGTPAWRDDANTTYGLASTTANGLLRKLDNNTAHYMRGDGTWQTPPDTNTWRGIQNTLTSTSTTDSLSANMGKTLWDRMSTIGYVLVNGTGTQTVTNTWKNIGQVTLTPGTWIVFGEARSAASQQGKNFTLRFSFGSYRQTCYIPTADNASASLADTWTVTANTVVNAQVWSSSVTIESGGMTAIRIRNF